MFYLCPFVSFQPPSFAIMSLHFLSFSFISFQSPEFPCNSLQFPFISLFLCLLLSFPWVPSPWHFPSVPSSHHVRPHAEHHAHHVVCRKCWRWHLQHRAPRGDVKSHWSKIHPMVLSAGPADYSLSFKARNVASDI